AAGRVEAGGRRPRRDRGRPDPRAPGVPQHHAHLRGTVRPATRPGAPRRDDVRVADVGRARGTSFLVPRSVEDIRRRRAMMKVWADASFGMLGRTGDYLNSCLMALSKAGEWFAQADPAFG